MSAEQLQELRQSGAEVTPKRVLPQKRVEFPAPAQAKEEVVPHAAMSASMARAATDYEILRAQVEHQASVLELLGEQLKEALLSRPTPVPWVMELERGENDLLTRVRMNPQVKG
jgi:hypothetical protein